MKYYPIEKNGVVPVYIQLAEIIKRNIQEERLKEGDLLPSEAKFMKAYDISRITVRNALLRLVYDGLLFKVHGRGTFVASTKLVAVTSPFGSLEKHLAERGIDITHELIEFVNVYPPDQIKIDLALKPGEQATKIKRKVNMHRKTIGMRTVFVPVDIGDNLRGLDLEHFSILNHLNQNPETRVAKMEVRVQAATVMDLEAELMEVEENSTILVRSVVFWDLGGRPVMAGRVIYLSQYVNLKMEITAESVSNGCNIKEIPAIDYWG